METYKLHVAGLERDLPICPLNDNLSIAGFVMFGDVEMTIRSAEELLKRVGDFDLLITRRVQGYSAGLRNVPSVRQEVYPRPQEHQALYA